MSAGCSCVSAVLHRRGVPYCASCGTALVIATAARSSRPHSQHDGERPPGCGRAKFLRVWRLAWMAKDPGATKDGRARLLAPETYDRHVVSLSRRDASPRQPTRRIAKTESVKPAVVADRLIEELGAQRKSG